ncbi:hypothetical protein CV093_10215 [Oceanobacillus sp. 143]|uniref:Uncharacterized protein n=1 Tax=Oceanobacillus zhaokaii TaxID=2052660 RepID=A0A345PGP9_9BACI|nr:hypothetical protein [Oceanobacillus zhaokaii]AXI09179.1 hypothetical protein CUC15_09675 [Oceanobacillus zhaokaii]QGS68713.1 hypothetical protein CV093_10215 [Oceanobacillus sp. 143]
MNRNEAFIASLKEWSNSISNGEQELKGLTFHLGYSIGVKGLEASIDKLEERINYLVSNGIIKKKFLIDGLIREVDNYLNRKIYFLGESIVNNEYLQESYLNDFDIVPEHAQRKSKEDIKISIIESEQQIDQWNRIKSTYFTRLNEREWQDENIRK